MPPRIAPASTAQGAFELKAGDLVTAKREYGDFILVHTLDQRSGWVSKPRSSASSRQPRTFTDVMRPKG
jgi:hypothetical protein